MNKYIDHTVLKAFATKEDIIKLCNEAKEYNFKSVCVNPCYVKLAKELLQGSDVFLDVVLELLDEFGFSACADDDDSCSEGIECAGMSDFQFLGP